MDQYPFKDVKKLADSLGIDLHTDKEKYLWFIKQALDSLLPHDWNREKARGRTFYHNPESAITTEKHPMLYRFRAAFNRLVTNNVQLTLETKGQLAASLKHRKLYGAGDIAVLSRD
jgi:hypothetical protein